MAAPVVCLNNKLTSQVQQVSFALSTCLVNVALRRNLLTSAVASSPMQLAVAFLTWHERLTLLLPCQGACAWPCPGATLQLPCPAEEEV